MDDQRDVAEAAGGAEAGGVRDSGSVPGAAAPAPALAAAPMVTVTLALAGQSNMSGRAGLERVEGKWQWTDATTALAERLGVGAGAASPGVLSLGGDGDDATWVAAAEPLHSDVDARKTCGVGPALMLARRLRQHAPAVRVRLIPCAVGETSIADWAPDGPLCKRMLARCKGHSVDAFLWYQGESDALNAATASPPAYAEALTRLIGHVRGELALPELPVLLVRPEGAEERLPHLAAVQAQVESVASADDNAHLVALGSLGTVQREDGQLNVSAPHMGVPTGPVLRHDNVHLTAHALGLLASGMADLLAKIFQL